MKDNYWSIHFEVVIFAILLGAYFLIDSKIERQRQKTDKLYEMFYEIVRDKK